MKSYGVLFKYFSPEYRFKTFVSVIAFLLGFSLPTSNFLMNFSLVLALFCVLSQIHQQRDLIKNLVKNPLIWLPASMFLLLLFSVLTQNNLYAELMIDKYKKLLYILPLSLFFLISLSLSSQFIRGFLLANALTLSISLFIGEFHFFWVKGCASNPTVFKLHITQNFFMALAALIWLQQTFYHKGIKSLAYALLTCIAVYNIFFMVQGRTGYVALLVAFFVWIFLSCSKLHQLIMIIGALILGAVLVIVPNHANERIQTAVKQIQTCLVASEQNVDEACDSSMGLRTLFALNSWQLIKKSPWLGHGAGGGDYRPYQSLTSTNAHNEYLMQTVQSGFIGLAVFLLWMWFFFRISCQHPPRIKNLFIAVLVSYLVCHFFNSFLLDSSEGHLFVILTAILAGSCIDSQTQDNNKRNLDVKNSLK